MHETFRWSQKSPEIFLRTFLRKDEFLIFFTTQSNSIEIIKSEIKYFEFIESEKKLSVLGGTSQTFPYRDFSYGDFLHRGFPYRNFHCVAPPN